MQLENEDIRRAARAAGVPFWKIASELEVSEPTLTRWMRVQLTGERREKIIRIIERLSEEAT